MIFFQLSTVHFFTYVKLHALYLAFKILFKFTTTIEIYCICYSLFKNVNFFSEQFFWCSIFLSHWKGSHADEFYGILNWTMRSINSNTHDLHLFASATWNIYIWMHVPLHSTVLLFFVGFCGAYHFMYTTQLNSKFVCRIHKRFFSSI